MLNAIKSGHLAHLTYQLASEQGMDAVTRVLRPHERGWWLWRHIPASNYDALIVDLKTTLKKGL